MSSGTDSLKFVVRSLYTILASSGRVQVGGLSIIGILDSRCVPRTPDLPRQGEFKWETSLYPARPVRGAKSFLRQIENCN